MNFGSDNHVKLSTKACLFHSSVTADDRLPEVFHELKPDIANYKDLTYEIIEIEPISDAVKSNSICFSVEGADFEKRYIILLAGLINGSQFIFNLEHQVARFLSELLQRHGLNFVDQMRTELYYLYSGKEPLDFDSGSKLNAFNSEICRLNPHTTNINVITFRKEDVLNNVVDKDLLLYQFWRFNQIHEEILTKSRGNFSSFRKLRERCLKENIFPEFFSKQMRF